QPAAAPRSAGRAGLCRRSRPRFASGEIGDARAPTKLAEDLQVIRFRGCDPSVLKQGHQHPFNYVRSERLSVELRRGRYKPADSALPEKVEMALPHGIGDDRLALHPVGKEAADQVAIASNHLGPVIVFRPAGDALILLFAGRVDPGDWQPA